MEQPTKEEEGKVTTRKAASIAFCAKAGYFQADDIMGLVDAYLALREDVKAERETEKKLNDMSTKNLLSHIATLKAENQALKALCENLEISIPTPLRVTLVDEATEQKGTT